MKRFTLCAVLAAVLGLSLTAPGPGPDAKKADAECRAEFEITDTDFEKAHQTPQEVVEKLKCYSHCLLEKLDALDGNGKFSIESLRARGEVDEKKIEAVENCKMEHDAEENKCEYAFKMIGCMIMTETKA